MAEETLDKSYNEDALKAFNEAIRLDSDKLKYDSASPQYLIERASLHAEMGNYELAKQDLDLVKQLPKEKGVIGLFIRNTIADLEKVLNPEVLPASEEHVATTSRVSSPHLALSLFAPASVVTAEPGSSVTDTLFKQG